MTFSWCLFFEWRKKTIDLSEKWKARQGHIIYEVVNTRFLELRATSPNVSANLNQQNDIQATSTVFFRIVLANPPARRAGQLLYGSPVVQTLRWNIIILPQTRTACRSFLWWWTRRVPHQSDMSHSAMSSEAAQLWLKRRCMKRRPQRWSHPLPGATNQSLH